MPLLPIKITSLALKPKSYYLIIRLSNSKTSNIFYPLLFLALFIASFPLINSSIISREQISIPQQAQPNSAKHQTTSISINKDRLLTLIFHDLTNDGLMKKAQQHYKAIFMNNEEEGFQYHVINEYNMDNIPSNSLEKQNTIQENTIDFYFTDNFPTTSQFIEKTLKIGGVVTIFLNDVNPSTSLHKPSNYNIKYMRRFGNIIAIAMKKTKEFNIPSLGTQRKLLRFIPEAKKVALQNLEDVLLEPPRSTSGKSRVYLKRTRYLPDLMGDSLESYPRHVFIDVELAEKEKRRETDWFSKNYPTRNKNFEMYKISIADGGRQTEMTDWLRKNVREEEYVVMKAEAEVVEEIMNSKSIMLVDELFLECKPHRVKFGNKRSRRAYWECLALYGKLRDEGVAVHQWWG
ncbi:hypothetical protein RJT34_11977 [Clitoria ternatea]|uniref:DUF7870 domain-containing protein n=1 Tax=Clitoria ternatea TaxID=43366 RepID=A0AAN9PK16_CLITE